MSYLNSVGSINREMTVGSEPAAPLLPSPPCFPNRIDYSDAGTEEEMSL